MRKKVSLTIILRDNKLTEASHGEQFLFIKKMCEEGKLIPIKCSLTVGKINPIHTRFWLVT